MMSGSPDILRYVRGTLLTLAIMALAGIWQSFRPPLAGAITALLVLIAASWYLRASFAALFGAKPAQRPMVSSRALAHRSEPLDAGLSISIPVPPAIDATIALPSVAIPNVAGPVTPEPATLTRQACGALPAAVPWRVSETKATALPLLSDGVNWLCFNLHGSENLVVCGATGKGKGNAIQLLTLSALALGPEAAQVWYLDGKQGLDYSFAMDMEHARLYADIRSVDGKLLSDGALGEGFDAAITEMERRNQAMYKKARNAHEYAARMGVRWPVIVVVVDEAAELDTEQKTKLNKIARMGRAAGFILLTCTQYPTVEVLSSQVQSNAVCRVSFQLASAKYTPVALGLAPGEKSLYEPSAISAPGIAVYRRNGDERLGRVPEVTDQARDAVIRQIVGRWPRMNVSNVSSGTQLPEPPSRALIAEVVPSGSPDTSAPLAGSDVVPSGSDKMTKLRTLVALGVSSNAIVDALGGNRSDMLKIISLVKEGKL